MKKLMKSVLACLLAFAMVLSVMPVNSYAAAKKSVVVTNQKQLEKALKNGATNIVIKTNKNVKITIPATKKAAKASISIQAKNATITNKASVKSIVIKDAKAFVESGKNNDIKITDSKLSLTVAKGSKGADIRVAKKDAEIKVVAKGDVASVTVAKTADVTLTVNKTATVASVNVAAKGATVDLNAKGTVSDVKVSEKAADTKLNINASGKVENVQIDAKADVAVAGSTTEAVKVTVNAKDTTIKAETAVETTLNADAKVDLSKGAEGSKVTTAENVKVDVANNTEDKVTVTDSTGKETSVDAGKTETTKDESKEDDEKKDDQSSGGSSGGSSGTVTPTPTPSEPKNPEIVGATKTSIIIKAVAGQVYACVESGKKVGEADFEWTDEDIDELGNIEISGLDSTKKYEIYTRNQTSDPIKADQIVDLSNQKETVVLFDNSTTTLSGEGIWDDNNEQLIISAPIDFEFCVYGKASEAWDWEVGMDSNQPGIRFNGFPDDIKFEITPEFTGDRTGSFKFDYQVGTWNDDEFSPVAKREYTVNFEIPETDWNRFKKNSIPELENISVTAANMISLRFDVLVPEKISKDVVSVKDGSGKLVAIQSITRDKKNDYRYNIALEQNLTDGAYNVEITVYNTLCTESFTYKDSVWTPMNTVRTVVEKQLKKTYTPQGASLSSCEDTFKEELNQAFSDSKINTEDLGVYVGVDGYWIRYEGGKLFCSIEVDILSGSAKYELEQDVEFKLSQKPEIFGATKTSIVVNPIVGLEYTYVRSGEEIGKDAKWYGYDDYDDHDHIIFDKLDTTSYDVYYRRAESPNSISAATVVDLTKKQASFAVITDSNEEYAGKAYYNWKKGQLVVDVLIEPDVVVYDQNGFVVDEYDYSIDNKDSKYVVYQGAEADGYDIMISFAVTDTCQVNKDYTFDFDFNVMVGDDSDVTIGSKNYKVTFEIPQEEWDKKDETSDATIVDTWVAGADEIVLRFNNPVPSTIPTSDVVITKDGETKNLAIASIQKGENSFSEYVIKLASGLADASYTGTITVNNKKQSFKFTYKSSDLSIAKSILDSALSKLKQLHTEVANSFSESYYGDAIQKELFDFVIETVEEKNYDKSVSHGAGVSTLDIFVDNGEIKVSTVVSVFFGQSRAKIECVVPYSLCATPNVVAATKNSIIVRGVKGLEYACVKAGDDLSKAQWFDWTAADGNDGCIEISNLETTTYNVYYKTDDVNVSKATTVNLNDKMDTAIVFVSPVTEFEGAVSNNVVSVIGFMPYYNVYGKNGEPYNFKVVVSNDSAQKGISFNNYENSLQFELGEKYTPKGEDSFDFTYQVIDAGGSVIGEKTCTVSFYRYEDEN
ncbi:MAG: hypothetical protein MR943_10085 [Lachnobacterium sp.]|nr:hypothetical protein [Lachnobacterium sp.]